MRKQWLYAPAVLAVVAIINFTSGGVAHAGAQTCTWTGAGTNTNWSTAANWSCNTGTVPADGGALVFSATGTGGNTLVITNDLPSSLTYTGITFDTANGNAFDIQGNDIRLAGDITKINSGYGGSTIEANTIFTTNGSITSNGTGSIGISGTLSYGANTLTIGGVNIAGSIIGSGNINVILAASTGFATLLSGNSPSMTGMITVNSGACLTAGVTNSLGSSTAGTIVNDGACLLFTSGQSSDGSSPTYTTAEPLTLIGSSLYGNSKLGFTNGIITQGSSPFVIPYNSYTNVIFTNEQIIFSGDLTIQNNDVTVLSSAKSLTFTGNINGSGHTIALDTYSSNTRSSLILNGTTNNSLTPNGTYQITGAPKLTTLTDTLAENIVIGDGNKVCVNGTRATVWLVDGGILCGTGTVGDITVAAPYVTSIPSGHIAPGNSPGILNSGNVTLSISSTLDIELGGTAAGEYDQLNVTGTVDLAGATLNTILYNGYAPALNSTYTIINNDGTDAIIGTFAGLAQGASFTVGGYTFTISYSGGTGNDVVLTTTAVPAPPNTAGVLARPVNVIIAALVVATGIGVMIVRRAILKKSSRR